MPDSKPAIKDWIVPEWPAPASVRAVCTTRHGGVSRGTYKSMNPADHVGDAADAVASNRDLLQRALHLPVAPCWLQQVHGTRVIDVADPQHAGKTPVADAARCSQAGHVCVVLTADCLPVLLTNRHGSQVAAVHAGWRGLAAGVIEQTLACLQQPGEDILAWLGPGIGATAYQVGDEVRAAFIDHDARASAAFQPAAQGGWLADMYMLARQRLAAHGVTAVYGGQACSYLDAARFFSYRRDGVTGRMASLIWLDGEHA